MSQPKMNSAKLTQLIIESTPNQFDPAGKRRVISGLKVVEQPNQNWENFRPSGFNDDAYHAQTKSWRVLSGTIQLNFGDWLFLAPLIYGVAIDSSAAGGITTDIFELPVSGERGAKTATIEHGQRDACDRCLFGFVTDFSSISVSRDGQNINANITIICLEPTDENTDVPMTGWEAQNQKYDLTLAENATGSGTITIKDAGGSVLDTVTVAPGQSNNTVKSNLEAAAGITTVLITGGPLPANVAGASVAGGTPSATNTLGGSSAANARDGNTGTQWNTVDLAGQTYSIDWGAGNAKTLKAYKIYFAGGGSAAVQLKDWTFQGSNDNATWTTLDTRAGYTPTGNAYNSFFFNNTTAYRYYRFNITGVQSGTYAQIVDVTFHEEVTNAGATIGIEITSPAQTRFILETGSAGYTLDATQLGSAGHDVELDQMYPCLPQQASHRRADSFEELDDATPIDGAKEQSFGLSGLAEPVYFADENNLGFQNWVDGAEPGKEASIVVSASSSVVPSLRADAKKQPSQPRAFELRLKHADSVRQVRIQHWSAVKGASSRGAGGNVETYMFPLGPVLPESGSAHRLILSYPTPA